MLFGDFTYAARTLAKSPVFAATAIVTIALGIGASTAIFSVTDAVLLRPLPYKNPDRLFFAISDMRKRNVKDFPFSDADFIDLRNGAASMFQEIGAVTTGRITVPREDASPEQIRVAAVTPNFFRLMGGQIALGRDFNDADGQPQPAPAAAPAAQGPPRLPQMAILSYPYWQRRFGASRDVIGRPMPGRQGGTQIVGVLKPGFELLFPPDANIEQRPDVWFANRLAYDNAGRNGVSLRAIGRLKDGVTREQAQGAVDRVAAESAPQLHHPRNVRLVHSPGTDAPARGGRGAAGASRADGRGDFSSADRVRQRGQSAAGARVVARTRTGNTRSVGRQPVAADSSTANGSLPACGWGTVLGLGLAWAGIHELRVLAPANLPLLDAMCASIGVVLAYTALAGLAAAAHLRHRARLARIATAR
jgi:hypothetical protein